MKTNVKNIAIALFILSTTIFGCKKDKLEPINGNSTTMDQVPNEVKPPAPYNARSIAPMLMNGRWVIASFEDEGAYGSNSTDQFKGYLFKFNAGNVVIAEKLGKGVTGKWNVIEDINTTRIVLDFGVQPLILLNSTWITLTYSSTLVRLAKKGPGGTIHLDFKQIIEKPQTTVK